MAKGKKPAKIIRIVDLYRSLDIADEIDCLPCFCWRNAVSALRTSSLNLGDAKYVEGVFVTPNREYGGTYTIPHGWLELPDGTILDPTFAAHPSLSECDWLEDDYAPRQYVTLASYSLTDLEKVNIEDLPIGKDMYKSVSRSVYSGVSYEGSPYYEQ